MALAIIIALTILILFAAVFQYINKSIHVGLITFKEDRALNIADQGINKAVNFIRSNPDTIPAAPNWYSITDPTNNTIPDVYEVTDGGGKVIGRYRIRARQVEPDPLDPLDIPDHIFDEQIFLIESGGWVGPSASVPDETGVRVYSWVRLANIGNYFAAIKGDLNIRAITGQTMDLSQARIYGRNINFKDFNNNNPATRLDIQGVDFEAAYLIDNIPDNVFWLKNTDPLNPMYDVINITDSPDGYPTPVSAPKIFPTVNDDYFYYLSLQGTPAGIDQATFTGEVYPPSVALEPSINDQDIHHYWLRDGDISIGNARIHGQVIMVSRTKIIITGNITKLNDHRKCTVSSPACPASTWTGTDNSDVNFDDGSGPPSSAHQLVLIAPTIEIAADWCVTNSNPTNLKIEALLIAPDGTLKADTSVATCLNPANVPNQSLQINGGTWFASSPEGLPDHFGIRGYQYDNSLASDEPPLRQSFEVLKEIEIMTPQ